MANNDPGPAVDALGRPAVDPTENVKSLTEASVKRLDDLAELRSRYENRINDQRERFEERLVNQRVRFESELRAADHELRKAESDRIDAIRAVDVGNVQRAAEVQAQQALTLANQVSTSAETLRTQVQAAATAQTIALNAALDPIQKRIDDLTRAQYEAQGQKTQVVESRGASAAVYAAIGLGISATLAALAVVGVILGTQ